MVARNRVRCTVIAVPTSKDRWDVRRARARDLVPWADPYLAQLIRNLQDEVRRERRLQTRVRHRRLGANDRLSSEPNMPAGDGSSQCGLAW